MALLAEGKRKVKYGLDPQNTNWSNDTSKFGQRLMEKMGWEKGKGLGANENGMTEHIKANYKWDQAGLGAGPQSADAWVAHQDDYNDLLKMLNSGNQGDKPEDKNETSKVEDGSKRYYGRFARGRVQKLRTTEDLDCIFGRRKSSSAPATPSNQSATNSDDADSGEEDETTEKSHGLTTVTSTTSVQDYFANKMREMRARQMKSSAQEDGMGGTEKSGQEEGGQNSEPAVYGMVKFSYGDSDKKEIDEKDSENGENQSQENPTRGWYHWKIDQKEEGDNNQDRDHSSRSKSKKKKKDKRAKTDNDLDPPDTSIVKDSSECIKPSNFSHQPENAAVAYDDVEERQPSKKKKRKKSKKDTDVSEELNKKAKVIAEDPQPSECGEMEETKQAEMHDVNLGTHDSKESERSSKKKKRRAEKEPEDNAQSKRKKRKSENVLSIDNEEESSIDKEEDVAESSQTKSKKKKKKSKEVTELVNGNECDSLDLGKVEPSSQILDPKSEKREKKNKRKKNNLEELKTDDVSLNSEPNSHSNHRISGEGTGDSNCVERTKIEETGLSVPFKRKRKGGKKSKQEVVLPPKPVAFDPKKSIFPGSNLEVLQGYGEIKAPPPKEEEKVVVKIKKSRPNKEYWCHRARDVGENLKSISRLQGGMVGHEH